MTKSKFKVGDKVKLVSDGEKAVAMTVESYYLDSFAGQMAAQAIDFDWTDWVTCIWRDKNSKLQRETFHEETLIKV